METQPHAPGTGGGDPDRDRQARGLESAHRRIFLARLLLTALLAAVYLFSGASVQLAGGLRARFGSAWWLENAIYIALTFFGFAAFLFPLRLYADYVLEEHYVGATRTLGQWCGRYLRAQVVELAVLVAFFEIVYAVLRWFPNAWWLLATVAYTVFVVGLTVLGPSVIVPRLARLERVGPEDGAVALVGLAVRAGACVDGVFRWADPERSPETPILLAGLGRVRHIVVGDYVLATHGREELAGLLAHELGHWRGRHTLRSLVAGSALAAAGFYAAHRVLHALVGQLGALGIEGVADIAGFPVFVFALFFFSVLFLPLANGHARRLEYAADDFAVRLLGSSEPLVGSLERLADAGLFERRPPAWAEKLLHAQPALERRVRRARRLAAALGAAPPGSGAPADKAKR